MRVLFVLGSPRKKGNSETMALACAQEVEAQGETVEYLHLHEKSIKPCVGCGGCEKNNGNCVIEADDMGSVYEIIDRADRIIIVSPVYFYGITAQTKLFIDRFQAYWTRKYLLKTINPENANKKGYYMGCAATSGQKLFDGCLLTVKCYFDALDIPYRGELLVRGVDERGSVANNAEILKRCRDFAGKIISS